MKSNLCPAISSLKTVHYFNWTLTLPGYSGTSLAVMNSPLTFFGQAHDNGQGTGILVIHADEWILG